MTTSPSAGETIHFTGATTWELQPEAGGAALIASESGSINSTTGDYVAPRLIHKRLTVRAIGSTGGNVVDEGTIELYPTPIKVSPATVDLGSKQQQQFSVEPKDYSQAVTWELQNSLVGRISPSGVYTAPSGIFRTRTVVVTAKSDSNPSVSGSATINLTDVGCKTIALVIYWIVIMIGLLVWIPLLWPTLCQVSAPAEYYISPRVVTSQPGAHVQFHFRTLSGTNDPQTQPLWNGPRGTIDSSGSFTSPGGEVRESIKITAVPLADPKRRAEALVHLSTNGSLSITPEFTVLKEGQLLQFQAQSSGGDEHSKPQVSWSLPAGIGQVSADGLYVAPDHVAENTSILVFAKLSTNPAVEAAATVVLVPQEQCSGVAGRILLVILMGALGSILHGIASFVLFVGNRQFLTSWFWWYIFRPLVGGALALLFFFIIGGGLLTGENGANVTRLAAIAGLIGLFSDQATLKLADIFEALFTPRKDPRKDPLTTPAATDQAQFKITKTEPSSIKKGIDTVLQVDGIGFEPGAKVKVNDLVRDTKFLSSTQLSVLFTAAETAQASEFKLAVVNPAGRQSADYVLKVT